MAVWLIVSATFAIIAVGIGTYVLLPVLDGLYNDENTQSLTGRARAVADSNYQIASLMTMMFTGGIFLALFARAARRDRSEFIE